MHASAIRLDVAPALIFSTPSQPPDFSGLDEVVALAQTYHLQVVGRPARRSPPGWRIARRRRAPRAAAPPTTSRTTPRRSARSCAAPTRSSATGRSGTSPTRLSSSTGRPSSTRSCCAPPTTRSRPWTRPTTCCSAASPASRERAGWRRCSPLPAPTPIHAFDIANLHERGDLWQLAADVASFRQFLAGQGFAGPLWVTEHGYPSDPQYQYDPGYTGGEAAQAVLPGGVGPHADRRGRGRGVRHRARQPQRRRSPPRACSAETWPTRRRPIREIVRQAGVRRRADDRRLLRAVSDATAPARPRPRRRRRRCCRRSPPGQTSTTVGDRHQPGHGPDRARRRARSPGPTAAGLAVASNPCAGMVLEPRETCAVSVRFAPAAGGDTAGDARAVIRRRHPRRPAHRHGPVALRPALARSCPTPSSSPPARATASATRSAGA